MTRNSLQAYKFCLFSALYVGYATYILDRRSFSNVIPHVIKEGLSEEAIGGIVSSLALAYAVGKFVCEIIVDSYSPRLLHCTGLVLCGITNLCFTFSSSKFAFTALWFLNGLFQGFGWPTCGKLVQRWYSPNIFGTLWSLLSTSMNVAASIGPLVCALLVNQFDSWKLSMQLIGSFSIIYGIIVYLILKDNPEDGKNAGFTNIKEKNKSSDNFLNKTMRIAKSPYSYVLSYMFFISIMSKIVISDWGPLYLIQKKNASTIDTSLFNGFVEIGGLVGSISGGMLTDLLLKISRPGRYGHPRHKLLILFSFGLAINFHVFRTVLTDVNNNKFLFIITGFFIGFCIYGLINIAGVLSIENASPELTGASHAITSVWGNIGLMTGGLPFSIIVTNFSWDTAYLVVQIGAFLLGILLVISQWLLVCKIGYTPNKDKEE